MRIVRIANALLSGAQQVTAGRALRLASVTVTPLPPTASLPWSFGAPNFAVMDFKLSIDFVTLGSA